MAQVVILSGGKGTRLAEYLNGRPKSLALLKGKTLLEHQLLLAKKNNLNKILLLLGFKSEDLIQFCNVNSNFGLDIKFVVEPFELGTAGALLNAINLLDDTNLILYGDTFLNINLQNFLEKHRAIKAPISIYVHPNDHPSDSDLVVVKEDGHVKEFVPYPHNGIYPNLVNAGLYAIDKVALEGYKENIYKHDIARNFFPNYISNGNSIFAHKGFEFIKDCGTIQRLKEVEEAINSGRVESRVFESFKKAVFIDRDGTLNKNDAGYIINPNQIELIEGVDVALKNINKSSYLSILITNQPVIARGDIGPGELRIIHNKLETLLGEKGAYLDDIYYCPHHPDAGFANEILKFKKICKCRKPETGLIESAIRRFNIDRLNSWIIGDSTVDIAAGIKAELRTILVETGKRGMDSKCLVNPDYTFNNFGVCVNFILGSFDRLMSYFNKLDNNYRLISIAGYSRSGKSNLASVISHFYQKKYNRVVHKISTDRWIKSGVNKGGSCLERHNLEKFLDFLKMCKSGKNFSFELPFYNKVNNLSIQNHDKLHIRSEDLIIFEGVLCNFIDNLDFKFFVDLSKNEYTSRIRTSYESRGYSGEKLQSVIKERIAEFYEIQKNDNFDQKFVWEEWL